jgi:hypothetical protein
MRKGRVGIVMLVQPRDGALRISDQLAPVNDAVSGSRRAALEDMAAA